MFLKSPTHRKPRYSGTVNCQFISFIFGVDGDGAARAGCGRRYCTLFAALVSWVRWYDGILAFRLHRDLRRPRRGRSTSVYLVRAYKASVLWRVAGRSFRIGGGLDALRNAMSTGGSEEPKVSGANLPGTPNPPVVAARWARLATVRQTC